MQQFKTSMYIKKSFKVNLSHNPVKAVTIEINYRKHWKQKEEENNCIDTSSVKLRTLYLEWHGKAKKTWKKKLNLYL